MHHPIINLPLGVEGINEILEALSARPYNRVADLINHLKAHAERQLQAAAAMNNGVIDARDLYTIRKEGVNEIIDTLMAGRDPKVSKKVAADVLTIVRPEIDNAIVRAGGTEWKQYLKRMSYCT